VKQEDVRHRLEARIGDDPEFRLHTPSRNAHLRRLRSLVAMLFGGGVSVGNAATETGDQHQDY